MSIKTYLKNQKKIVPKKYNIRIERYRINVNADFGSLQIGQRHVFGRSSKDVPGGIF